MGIIRREVQAPVDVCLDSIGCDSGAEKWHEIWLQAFGWPVRRIHPATRGEEPRTSEILSICKTKHGRELKRSRLSFAELRDLQ